MVIFERFEAAKILRFISRYSKAYTVQREVLNEFKEPTGDTKYICSVFGVYHEASYKHLASTASDAGVYVPEVEPMILCLKDNVSDLIQVGDIISVNGKEMAVTKIKDINNSGFACDISLRWIDDGSQS